MFSYNSILSLASQDIIILYSLFCLNAFPHLLFSLFVSPSASQIFLMGLFSFVYSKSFRMNLNEHLLEQTNFF